MIVTIISGFLIGLLAIGQASALSHVISGVFLAGWSLSDASGLLELLGGIVFSRALLAWLSEVSANAVAVRVKSSLRKKIFEKIFKLGPVFTRQERTGELVNVAVEGIEALDAYFSQYLPQLVVGALVPLSILVTVFPRDPLSGLVLLVTAPLIPIFMYLIGSAAQVVTKRQWDTLSRLSAHFLDSLQGLTTLKELSHSKERADSIAKSSDRFRDVTLKVLRVTFLSALVLELVATVSTAVVAVEVGLRLLYGHLAYPEALFLLLLAPEFYLPLRMLGLRFHAGMSGTTAARRIFEVLDMPNQEKMIVSTSPEPFPLFTTLSLTNLSYIYPGEAKPALHDLNMMIHAGEHIALVGKTGSGKSTLAALLLRFIEPCAGSICMDGKLLNEIPAPDWRGGVAWVPQSPHLFHNTVSYNIRIAKPDASDAEVAMAAKMARLDIFIQSLPQGYETVIGEEGFRLSGGEAQRLALARAFLKNAPVLILDEPTSSLDPENEMLIASAVRQLMVGRTVITIAHRINTVYHADRIYVLSKGSIVEAGTHVELMKRGGAYADLVRIQTNQLNPKNESLEEGQAVPRSDALREVPLAQVNAVPSHHRLPVLIRLLQFLNGSWSWVVLSVLLGVLTVGSNIGLMSVSAYLISTAALHPELGTLQIAIVGVRFFGITRGLFRYAERLATHNTTFRLISRLRTWFYRALEPLAPARLMYYKAGDVLSRVIADVANLENFYVRVVAPPLVAIVIAAGMSVFFGHYDPHLSGIYLAFMLAVGLGLPLLSGMINRRPGAELVNQKAGLQSFMVDGIQGLADLTVYDRGSDFIAGLVRKGETYRRTQLRLASLSGISNALTVFLAELGMLAVLVTGIPLVTNGVIPGVMLAVLALAALAGFEAVMPLPLAAQKFSPSLQSARRLFELVDTEPAVKPPAVPIHLPEGLPIILFSGLGFTYPGSPEPVLYDINFKLAPGERLAVVGSSGAGKSTLVNLLMRFWEPTEGSIKVGGRDIHEYTPEDARRLFSVVAQRTFFFNESIRQNLVTARTAATDAEIHEATERAQIDEFIQDLPAGFETLIGERGYRLSGGERQKLAIARALLKSAPIFLLDEPTANLDPITEKSLLLGLFNQAAGHSLLLITHRLVGMEYMDEILVLDHGKIVERGSHVSLLAAHGAYWSLWDLQNRILQEK